MRHTASGVLIFCLPLLSWTATGLLAGWLAIRRGKSWRRGFILGFLFSTAGVMLASLPSRHSLGRSRQEDGSDLDRGTEAVPPGPVVRQPC